MAAILYCKEKRGFIMASKMNICKTCGLEIAKSAKYCPKCGAKNKRTVFTKWWFWVLVVMLVGIIAGAGGESDSNSASNNAEITSDNATVKTVASIFDGDCGIMAYAEIGNNIIDLPEISMTVTNTTDKEIAAIKFYAVPYDVYGDEIEGWTTQNELYTDAPIAAGETTSLSYQLIEQSVKTVKLYVYSVGGNARIIANYRKAF